MGKHHFYRAVFNLPIPTYDAKRALHVDLAKAAARAERIAGKVELRQGEHFTRTRKRIRLALIENGVAGEIEALVAALIGVPAPATLSAGPDDRQEDDAD